MKTDKPNQTAGFEKQKIRDSVNAEIQRIEAMIGSGPTRRLQISSKNDLGYVRPKNAASIILINGKPGDERVLMGRRNKALKFMPGALVFPGGRVDPQDHNIPTACDMDNATRDKLIENMRGKTPAQDAKALAVAAIRELAEETGLLIGTKSSHAPQHPDWLPFSQRGLSPTIEPLRLVARAITPVGSNRRFDTWFFTMRFDKQYFTPPGGFDPSGELEDLQWISPMEAMGAGSREITRVILVELMRRLEADPALTKTLPVPSYRTIGQRFIRKLV